MKNHNRLVFLNVYIVLIYVVTWCNKEQLTKSQKMPIGRKYAYWMKICILAEKPPIEKWKVITVCYF